MYPNKRVLSLGAGVQSSCLALMNMHYPDEYFAYVEDYVFADTMSEPSSGYRNLSWLQDQAKETGNVTIHVVSAGNLRDDALGKNPNKKAFNPIPVYVKKPNGKVSIGRRQCTREFKLAPVIRKQRELIGLGYKQRRSKAHGTVTNILGISYDEVFRVKDHRLEPFMTNEYPLIDMKMTRQDCLDWQAERNYPVPPRSACTFCPFHSKDEWMDMKANDEESWQDAVLFDKQLREINPNEYLHSSCMPLDQVTFTTKESANQLSLLEECEGMCGL